MKVLLINGSPNTEGNTYLALKTMSEELQKMDIMTEIVQVGNQLLHGCIGCGHCFKSEGNKCVFDDDLTNEITQKMRDADGFVLGSPTYFGGIAGTFKCFLDRAFFSSYATVYFKNKVATAVAIARRDGGTFVFNQLMNYLNLAETVIPPSQYWGAVHGAVKGEILFDEEGMQTIRRNANAMGWLLKSIDCSKETVEAPYFAKKARTNFVR